MERNNLKFNESYIGIRHDLLKNISGKGLNILDIGCATGVNGAFLKNQGMAKRVVGIELSDEMAKEAESNLDKVIVGNIENKSTIDQLGEEIFDFIIIGDVLEHLYDPWAVLNQLTSLLTEKGKIIISVPNIQHIELFISIYIKGEWPYNDRGIFDKTHLRWFTYKNILQIEEKCNLKIQKIERVFRFRDRLDSKFPFYGKALKKVFPNIFTFQYFVVTEKWKKE